MEKGNIPLHCRRKIFKTLKYTQLLAVCRSACLHQVRVLRTHYLASKEPYQAELKKNIYITSSPIGFGTNLVGLNFSTMKSVAGRVIFILWMNVKSQSDSIIWYSHGYDKTIKWNQFILLILRTNFILNWRSQINPDNRRQFAKILFSD